MERVYLFNSKNYMDIFLLDELIRPVVLIVPGGGYTHTSERESGFVSDAFKRAGYHTAILKYREELFAHPRPMEELAFCVDYLKKFNYIDKNKIILIGFSAGAHNVANLANHYMEFKNYSARPDACILSYPVVTTDPLYSHKGSFQNLLQDKFSEKLLDYVDIEKNVHKDFPKTFLWHTADDESVNVMNSLKLAMALKKNNVYFEYHIFPSGVHGLSLANKESSMGDNSKYNPYVSRWFDMVLNFLKESFK